MTQKSNEKLKDILERKLKLVKDYRHTNQYFRAAMDYHLFICTSDALKPILEQLIEEERIAPIYLEQIFSDVMIHTSITQVDVKNKPIKARLPNFYSKAIEEKYKLAQKFFDFIKADYEDYKQNPDQLLFDPNIPVIKTERDDEFFYTQKLHIDILEKLNFEDKKPVILLPEKLPYWQEDYLYLVYKILKSNERLIKTALSLNDLQSAKWTPQHTFMKLGMLCEQIDIQFAGVIFHEVMYEQYCPEEYKNAKQLIKDNPKSKQAIALKKIFNNDFQIQDFSGYGIFALAKFSGLYEFIEFDTQLSHDTQEKLSSYLQEYLELFMSNHLVAEHQNYVTFSVMKAELLGFLRRPHSKYGNSFLLNDKDVHLFLTDKDEFLFLHTFVALEHLQYLLVENLWVFDMDLPPEKQTDNYKIRLHLLAKFLEDDEPTSAKIEPAPVRIEQQAPMHQLDFDPDKAILFVDDKPVKLTKFSNQYHCLRILFENQDQLGKEWFYSEIAEKFDAFRNSNDKVFNNAFSQIKIKVALKAGFEDLFHTTIQSVKIDPKYISQKS